jgi:hypothetical protein
LRDEHNIVVLILIAHLHPLPKSESQQQQKQQQQQIPKEELRAKLRIAKREASVHLAEEHEKILEPQNCRNWKA